MLGSSPNMWPGTMKVKELIELLKAQDPSAVVVLASDAEGNRFRKLDGYCAGQFKRGEFETTDEDYNAVCLWPQ